MTLPERLQPWSGPALRHIPAGAHRDVLDFTYAGRSTENRWNVAGEPTLYLASGSDVAVAEFGRHFREDRTASLGAQTVERTVYRLTVALDAVLDLRDAAVWGALSLPNPPHCFLDREIARATARFVRATTAAQGLWVPSVAFLDDLTRGNLVVFLEKLPANPTHFILHVDVVGTFRWSG